MRNLLPTVVVVFGMSLAGSGVLAAPVPGNPAYVTLYNAAFVQCTVPAGTLPACEAAINAYANALVTDGVDIETANASFTALRAEVFAANASDPTFQAQIDALFEELLPDSGAIDDVDPVAPTEPGTSLSPGGGAPTPASPV